MSGKMGRISMSAIKRTPLGKMDLTLISIESVQIQAPVPLTFRILRWNKLLPILIQPQKDEQRQPSSMRILKHHRQSLMRT